MLTSVPALRFEPDSTVDSTLGGAPRFDTLSDTLRSGHGCDFWTRLDPEFANSLSKTTDLDTSGRGWTAHNVIRNQQVSGSSPLAGSDRINNLQGFGLERTDPHVTIVSPPARWRVDVDAPPARRVGEGRSTQASQPRSRRGGARPSPSTAKCGTGWRSPAR